MTKQVTATTMIKRRRTKTISTVNLPRMQLSLTTRVDAPVPLPRRPSGDRPFRYGAHELRGMNARPVPAVRGMAGYRKVTPRVYTSGLSLGSTWRTASLVTRCLSRWPGLGCGPLPRSGTPITLLEFRL